MPPNPGRIGDRATFCALRRSPRRVRRGPITVTWVEGGPWLAPRVAYAIGRKVGGAVERNRIRRRLRAIFAEAAPTLPLGSYQVGVGPRGRDLSFGELRAYVHQALEALGPEERR